MSRYRDGDTETTSCPWTSSAARTSPPNWAFRRSAISAGDRGARLGELATPLLPDVFAGDLLLEPDDAMQEGLRTGRATRHVNIDRDYLINTFRHGVGVPVRPATVRAGPERDHVLRIGHLVVHALERGCHLVGERARHDHQVGLAGAVGDRDHPQAHEVVLGRRGGDELDGTTG